jgi:hypothetical protein
MPVDEIKRLGRATQGVIVMRLRGDERVSALAPVVDSDDAEVEIDGEVGKDLADPAGDAVGKDLADPAGDAALSEESGPGEE